MLDIKKLKKMLQKKNFKKTEKREGFRCDNNQTNYAQI